MKALQRKFLAALLALSLLAGLLPATATTAQAAGAAIGETVEFAGHEWYIIGTPSEGVTAPEGCYTLFAKDNDFGSTTFRAGGDRENNTANYYKDSDLQKKLEEIANGFSEEDSNNIVARSTLDNISGDTVENQYLWPLSATVTFANFNNWLSGGELYKVSGALRKFDATYWTRTGFEGSYWSGLADDETEYYYDVIGVNVEGSPTAYCDRLNNKYATPVTDTLAIRPALYVKQGAVTFEGAFYVGTDTITSASVGGSLVANAGQGVPLLIDSSLSADVLVESGDKSQSGASLSFRLRELDTSSGPNQVVACVLTDSTGAVKYYGKLADLSQALSGWRDLSVPLAGVANGTYTLSIFAHNTATNAISAPTPTMTVTVQNGVGTVSNYQGGTYIDGGTSLNFTQHPQSLEVKLNEIATFSVEVVTGDGSDANITYTWEVQRLDGNSTWEAIVDDSTGQNYNSSSITFTDLAGTWADNGFSLKLESLEDSHIKISDGLRIRCVAKSPSAHFAEESNVATLTVDPAPAFTQQPQNVTAEAGGSTSFSAEAVGIGGVTYTWQAQPKTSNPEYNMWYDIYAGGTGTVVNMPYQGQTLYLPHVSGSWQDNEKILHDGHSTVSVSGFDPAEARFRCVAKDGSGRVIYSEPAELKVTGGLVSGVSVTPSAATVEKGSTQQFNAVVSGTGDYDQSVTWSVEDAESASTTISTSGLLSVGADETATTLTVRATSTADDSKSGTAAVTVTEGTAPEPAAVTTIAGYGGSIDQTTFTATADEGFVIDQLWVDGEEVSAASGQTTYTSDDPQSSVFVTFAYTVEVETPANGTLTVTRSGASLTSGSLVHPGDELTLTATPASGYTLASLSVNGANVTPADNVYTYTVGSQPTQTRSVGDATVAAAGAAIAASFSEEEDPDDPPVTPPEEDPDDQPVTPPEEPSDPDDPDKPSEPSEPAGPGDSDEPDGPATADSAGWRDIQDEITSAEDGDTIVVDMNGSTEVPKEIFETVQGKDVDVVFEMEDGVSWTVSGADIPTDAALSDLDLGVDLGTDGIPVDVINTITGEVGTVQITLAHDGDFGFAMTMTAPLGKENAGYWANLYHFDEDAEAMRFETAAKIDDAGYAALLMRHASQYAIVIDDHSHAALSVSDIFVDVAPDAWYTDAVQYAYDHGLMTGTSATTFAPNATTTRAMIVSILARQENVTSAEDAGFTDVDENDWFATAVNWAAREGIVAGFEDDTFRPNDAITREQLAAILCNYSAWKGEDTSARADLDEYTDAISISSWATDTMSWAVAEQLLAGVTENTLEPQGAATRAQVAAVLQRFLSE